MRKVTFVEAYHKGDYAYVFAMVESSFIDYLAWFSGIGETGKSSLIVKMSNGTQYRYTDVPLEVWNKVVNAQSVGTAYNEHVKNVYEVTLIKEPAKSEDVFA